MSLIEGANRFISNVLGAGLITFVTTAVFGSVDMTVPRVALVSSTGALTFCAGSAAVVCFGGAWLVRVDAGAGSRRSGARSGGLACLLVGLIAGVVAGAGITASVRKVDVHKQVGAVVDVADPTECK